jgi:small subunit ribosomal protein S16
VKVDAVKAADWIKKGAQPTDRVLRFLSKVEVDGKPVATWTNGNNPNKGEPGKKAQERAKERAGKAAARAAAAAEPAEG